MNIDFKSDALDLYNDVDWTEGTTNYKNSGEEIAKFVTLAAKSDKIGGIIQIEKKKFNCISINNSNDINNI